MFDQGLAGLKEQFNFDLSEPQRQLDKYTSSLRDELDAMKAADAVRIQSLTLGDHEAANLQQLAQTREEATKAVHDFIAAHQLVNGTLSADDEKTLQALKKHNDAVIDEISRTQQTLDAAR